MPSVLPGSDSSLDPRFSPWNVWCPTLSSSVTASHALLCMGPWPELDLQVSILLSRGPFWSRPVAAWDQRERQIEKLECLGGWFILGLVVIVYVCKVCKEEVVGTSKVAVRWLPSGGILLLPQCRKWLCFLSAGRGEGLDRVGWLGSSKGQAYKLSYSIESEQKLGSSRWVDVNY